MTYLPPNFSSLRYARVAARLGFAQAVAVKIAIADKLSVGKGPGLTQDEATQVCASLAWSRDVAMYGRPARIAAFQGGKLIGADYYRAGDGIENVPIVGDAPKRQIVPPGDGLPADWGVTLANACDAVLGMIRKSETATQIPIGYSMQIPAAFPVVSALIVGGLAVTVIGSVAAWRYLSPEARTSLALVEASATAYRARLAAYQETGKMPPASELETNTATMVKELAEKGRAAGFWSGAAVGGGAVAAIGGGIALSKLLEQG